MRIINSWEDVGDTYFTVELEDNRFVDVRSPEREHGDFLNGFLHVINLNGGDVYSAESNAEGKAVGCLEFLDMLNVLDYVSAHADQYLKEHCK